MENYKNHRPWLPLLMLSVSLLFLGVNGFIGGYLMLREPNGAPMGMPLSHLERTPFENWLIPGLCLIFIWGFGSLVILGGLWLQPKWPIFERLTFWTHEHWSWGFSILLGLALLIWLTAQVFTLPEIAVIQYILYFLAVLLIGIPLLNSMREYYRLNERDARWYRDTHRATQHQ